MLSGSGSSSSPSADIPEFGLLERPGPRLNTFTTPGIGHPHQEARDISESILVSRSKSTLGRWAPERVNALSDKGKRLEGRVGLPGDPLRHFRGGHGIV